MEPSVLKNLEKLKFLLDSKKDVINQKMTLTTALQPKINMYGGKQTYETITTDISGTKILSHTQNNFSSQHHSHSGGSSGFGSSISHQPSYPHPQQHIPLGSQIVRHPA